MYIYKRTEFSPYCLYTVGFYEPNGKWIPESDHETEKMAAERVHYLNGGNQEDFVNPYLLTSDELKRMEDQIKNR